MKKKKRKQIYTCLLIQKYINCPFLHQLSTNIYIPNKNVFGVGMTKEKP